MPILTLSQSEFELESKFSPRLWALHRDEPGLYEALLTNLAPVGLSSVDLRVDVGDGSVGARGLGFWLFGFNASVRLMLESFRFDCKSLGPVSRPHIIEAVDGVMATIAQVTQPQVAFTSHTISYSCHGQIEGTRVEEFLRRFAPTAPTVEGFGDHRGVGTAFYFGDAPPVLSSSLTLDPSKSVQDGLFFRVLFVVDSTPRSAEDLERLATKLVYAAFSSVDLEVSEPWS